jgi:predicted nucleic acid-binding protein
MAVLADTGVLYALADRDDAWHARARRYLGKSRQSLLVPVTVVPEVAYLLRRRLGAPGEAAFVGSLAAGEMALQELTHEDLKRCTALMDEYPQIGFVDASVVAVAERLRLRQIATTDRRHFAPIRPRHVERFELLP